MVAAALTSRGEALVAVGDPTAAREPWRRALAILDGAGDPAGERVRALLAGLRRSAGG